jgi:hypothetical protein
MKLNLTRLLLVAASAVALSGVASAATLCSSGGQGGPANFFIFQSTSLTQNGLISSGFSCSIGPYTFSNFSVFGNVITEAGGIPNFSLTESATTDSISFGFSPNLGNDDIGLMFSISPGVTEELLTAGPGTRVSELMCSVATTTAGGCSGTVLSLNNNWQAQNGGSSLSLITAAGTDWVFKDISGGSSVTQTIIPEPMTLSLVGMGLLGAGLFGRRLRRK